MNKNNNLNKMSHAYVVACEDPDAGYDAALKLAFKLICEKHQDGGCGKCLQCRQLKAGVHPDFITIERAKDDKGKVKKEILVDQIRNMASDAWVRPQQAEKKVYLIKEAGLMNVQAQNSALKILEEPPLYAAFILCTGSEAELLPTVRSRCVTLHPEGKVKVVENPRARDYIRLAAEGNLLKLCRFLNECEKMDNREFEEFADASAMYLADIICGRDKDTNMSQRKASQLLDTLRLAKEYLRANVGVKHILGVLSVRTI